MKPARSRTEGSMWFANYSILRVPVPIVLSFADKKCSSTSCLPSSRTHWFMGPYPFPRIVPILKWALTAVMSQANWCFSFMGLLSRTTLVNLIAYDCCWQSRMALFKCYSQFIVTNTPMQHKATRALQKPWNFWGWRLVLMKLKGSEQERNFVHPLG